MEKRLMEDKLKNLMAETFNLTKDSIDESTEMSQVNGWDSLRHMELVTLLEETFKITLEVEEILEMKSFSKILEILKGKGINDS
jgi:acyl carrier protein